MNGQVDIIVKHTALNILHQDKEHSNVALGMCKAGTNMNGQIHLVVRIPASIRCSMSQQSDPDLKQAGQLAN